MLKEKTFTLLSPNLRICKMCWDRKLCIGCVSKVFDFEASFYFKKWNSLILFSSDYVFLLIRANDIDSTKIQLYKQTFFKPMYQNYPCWDGQYILQVNLCIRVRPTYVTSFPHHYLSSFLFLFCLLWALAIIGQGQIFCVSGHISSEWITNIKHSNSYPFLLVASTSLLHCQTPKTRFK